MTIINTFMRKSRPPHSKPASIAAIVIGGDNHGATTSVRFDYNESLSVQHQKVAEIIAETLNLGSPQLLAENNDDVFVWRAKATT